VRIRQFAILLVVTAWVLALPGPAPAQLPDEPVAVGEILEEDLVEDIEALLAEAEEVFRAGDQPGAVPLFERIILLLERRQGEGSLDEQGGDWLNLSRFRRAEARHNLLDEEGATDDLRAILRFDPTWEVAEGYTVSRKLSDLVAGVRDAETGVLDPVIEPLDAELYLDGDRLGAVSGPRRVLAGERHLEVRRPGFETIEQPLTIPPGESVPIELTLVRTSAVIRLTTRPAGVEVILGGELLAVSEPQAEGVEDALSAGLVIEGLATGEQLLTLRKPGYRAVEKLLEIAELADYALQSVSLERTRGTVTISNLSVAARILLDGEPQASSAERGADLRLELPPGSHSVRVEAGSGGLYEHRFELEDRQLLEIDVRLRPSLVLLGVLGGSRRGWRSGWVRCRSGPSFFGQSAASSCCGRRASNVS
jgi:hypothetical protein